MAFVRGLSYGLATFVLLAFLYLRAPYLYDSDSYLHLAVSRLYTEQGFVEGLPWPRFSVMHDGYGDKELLFHVALIPFVSTGDAATGGRLALAAFDALVLTLLGALAWRRIGWAGWLVPFWVFVAAPPWNDRLMRLRPEVLALALLLLSAELVIRRRWAWLAVTAALYALAYTAFHVFVGLVVLWTILLLAADRKPEWRPLVATLAGTAAGLSAHPHPVDHLRIWALQNVTFFRMKGSLDVGTEILPPPWRDVVLVLGGWWLVILLVGVLAARRDRGAFRSREALVHLGGAIAFLGFYLAMGRMVVYFVPFATLAAVSVAGGAGLRRPGKMAIAAAAVFALVPGAIFSLRVDFLAAVVAGRSTTTEADLERLGRVLPAGAKVAATWSDAAMLAFWAPQGRTLNLYDPVFMVVPNPRAYDLQRAVFAGAMADVPPVLKGGLDSDYLALHDVAGHSRLLDVLAGDPRVRVVYSGASLLLRVGVPSTGRFLLDWDVSHGAAPAGRYPRRLDGRELEGFVDLTRVARPGECRAFAAPDPCSGCRLRFRAVGTARLLVDGAVVEEISSPRGLSAWKELAPAPRASLRVEACGAPSGGFFLFSE